MNNNMQTKKRSVVVATEVATVEAALSYHEDTYSQTIEQALAEAKNLLSVVADNPVLEAEILLAHVLDASRSYLHTWRETKLNCEQSKEFAACLLRRRNKEPIAYITGMREFWSLNFCVTPDTLIPRPETELLVSTVLDLYKSTERIKVADLGTGCGAIGLAIAHDRPKWQVYASDVSESALQIAKKNARRFALDNVSFHQGNWCAALPADEFDVIVSNPPYIGEMEWEAYAAGLLFEPRDALISGLDGLDSIRTICHSAKGCLKAAGYVLVEHGFLQGSSVRKIFAASGYSQIHSVRDLSGQERVTIAQYYP